MSEHRSRSVCALRIVSRARVCNDVKGASGVSKTGGESHRHEEVVMSMHT